MTYSCLVRLVPEELAEGRFVGQVEDVDTGVLTTVASLDDFVVHVRRLAAEQVRPCVPIDLLEES